MSEKRLGVDDYYPKIMGEVTGLVGLSLAFELRGRVIAALQGDRTAESGMANLLGSLRRSSRSFAELPSALQEAVREAVAYLRKTGREVDFDARRNPARWITRRDGSPRWACHCPPPPPMWSAD